MGSSNWRMEHTASLLLMPLIQTFFPNTNPFRPGTKLLIIQIEEVDPNRKTLIVELACLGS